MEIEKKEEAKEKIESGKEVLIKEEQK